MKDSEIKGAVNAAWSAAGTNLFKLDFNDGVKHSGVDVYPKTLDGELCGVSWRILPDVGVIVRYADNLKNGTSEIIEEVNFKDADDIERIFTDEFKSLDETLQLSGDVPEEPAPTDTYEAMFSLFGGDTHYELFSAHCIQEAQCLADEFGKAHNMTFFGIRQV